MTEETVIGVDLGTTNSCVAIVVEDKVQIIVNEYGDKTTPSIVAFTNHERIVGKQAKDLARLDPKNVVYDSKRMIGRTFNDPELQNNRKRWPFEVFDDNDNPKIRIGKGSVKVHSPEAISAMVLEKLKKTAENFLGHEVKNAVVTVPAHFTLHQKQATLDAMKIAGLNAKGIIVEPTAAAIAFGIQNQSAEDKNILVYDLGGGTFDVSILKLSENTFDVLAIGGNPNLGGQDFNNRLFDYCVTSFNQKFQRVYSYDDKAHKVLREKCEEAKKCLSTMKSVEIFIEKCVGNMDFRMTITREKFELINKDLFDSTIKIVETTVNDSGLTVDQIDEFILIGGSTRIPKIGEMLEELLKGKLLTRKVNPDEAVAYGAAIYAARIQSKSPEKQIQLHDVLPLSIGIEDYTGCVVNMFPRNTKYPATKNKLWKTVRDNQIIVTIKVYEGERKLAADNTLMGEIVLKKLPKRKAGDVLIETVFFIDGNGILKVFVSETCRRKWKDITISHALGRMSQEEVEKIASDAEKARQTDEQRAQLLAAKANLENLCLNVLSRVEEKNCELTSEHADVILYNFNQALKELEQKKLSTKEEIMKKYEMLTIFAKKFQIL